MNRVFVTANFLLFLIFFWFSVAGIFAGAGVGPPFVRLAPHPANPLSFVFDPVLP